MLIHCQNSFIWTEISHSGYLLQYPIFIMSFYISFFPKWGKKNVFFFKSPWIFTHTILALMWTKKAMLNLSTSLAFQSEVSFCDTCKKTLDFFSISSQLFQLILFQFLREWSIMNNAKISPMSPSWKQDTPSKNPDVLTVTQWINRKKIAKQYYIQHPRIPW